MRAPGTLDGAAFPLPSVRAVSRPIQAGDMVVLKRERPEAVQMYGVKATQPFVVEVSERSRGRYAVSGGGLMLWRSDCRRVRTALQLARDAAKKAEQP